MILLWGLVNNSPLAMVRAALERRNLPYFFLDQQRISETELELCVEGELVRGRLRVQNQTVLLEEITAVYLRPHDSRTMSPVQEAGENSPLWNHALQVEDALLAFVEVTPARVINRPSVMASNASKPYQAERIQATGLKTPPTLVTTDPEAVAAFQAEHGDLIYKSISGVRSIISRLSPDSLARLSHVTSCPTQFQKQIPGNDWRVHVVGDTLFTCEILSAADDYRYAGHSGHSVSIHSAELPSAVAAQCHAVARTLELPVTGIDLRCTPEEEWYCFEANPSPGFSYYEGATGLPISDAIASLLAQH